MPQNIEIKAKTSDNMQDVLARVARTGATGPTTLVQKDTFFHCPKGRMKLRECEGKPTELVVYLRENSAGPKSCEWVKFSVADAEYTRTILDASHGILGTVEKTRQLYLLGDTRIHVDEVKGLGNFIELEVLMDGKTQKDGLALTNKIMEQLGIKSQDLCAEAYIDMLRPDVCLC